MNVQLPIKAVPGVDSPIPVSGQKPSSEEIELANSQQVIEEFAEVAASSEANFDDMLASVVSIPSAQTTSDAGPLISTDAESGEPIGQIAQPAGGGVVIDILAAPNSSSSIEPLATKTLLAPSEKMIGVQQEAPAEHPGILGALESLQNEIVPSIQSLENQSIAASRKPAHIATASPIVHDASQDATNTNELSVELLHEDESSTQLVPKVDDPQSIRTRVDVTTSEIPSGTAPAREVNALANAASQESVDSAENSLATTENAVESDLKGATPTSSLPTTRSASGLTQVAEARANPITIASTVTSAVIASTATGDSRVEVQLDPPELGSVWIELTSTEDGLAAKIVSEHDTTSHMLQDNLATLRKSLSESGINVSDFVFDTEGSPSDRDRSAAETWNEKHQNQQGVSGDDEAEQNSIAHPGRSVTIGVDLVA